MIAVSKLALDLQNFRTVPQVDEVAAVRAMIAISPDMFWGLLDSLVEDGYLPTENIIVLDEKKGVHTVKEGNRRIAALKLLLGLIDAAAVGVTPNFSLKKQSLTPEWIFENSSVPCNVYGSADADLVDRIVTLTHGKGAKAGRDDWESIARARHNRKMGGKEVALDLLEQYLASGTNLTADQKDRWAGKYPLSVLDEAIKRIAPRCGYASSTALSTDFAKGSYRTSLEHIMHSIGANLLDFPTFRLSEMRSTTLRFAMAFPPSRHHIRLPHLVYQPDQQVRQQVQAKTQQAVQLVDPLTQLRQRHLHRLPHLHRLQVLGHPLRPYLWQTNGQ